MDAEGRIPRVVSFGVLVLRLVLFFLAVLNGEINQPYDGYDRYFNAH